MPVEMLQVLLTLLYTQRILAVYHDFHCFHWLLVARKLLTTKLNSCYDKVSEILERSELVSDILHLTPQPLFLLRVTVNYRVSHRRTSLASIQPDSVFTLTATTQKFSVPTKKQTVLWQPSNDSFVKTKHCCV